MGAQEKTEAVLREIHLFFQKAEPLQGTTRKVVVDKNEFMELLKELNACMYEMQEEYELTEQSRDAAARKSRKEGEDLIFEAQKRADDVYAGAIMYTDNALHEIQDIIQETNDQVYVLMERMRDRLRNAKENVRTNQTELKSELQDLIDTQKYLRLIEDENIRKAKEEARKAAAKPGGQDVDPLDEEPVKVTAVQPEIHINTEFLQEHGMTAGGEEKDEEKPKEKDTEKTKADGEKDPDAIADSLVKLTAEELDSEYFAWKGDDEDEDKPSGALEGLKDQFKEIFKK